MSQAERDERPANELTWRFDEETMEWVSDNGWRLDEYPVEPDDHCEWDIHLSYHGSGPGAKAFAQRLQNAFDGVFPALLTKESLNKMIEEIEAVTMWDTRDAVAFGAGKLRDALIDGTVRSDYAGDSAD